MYQVSHSRPETISRAKGHHGFFSAAWTIPLTRDRNDPGLETGPEMVVSNSRRGNAFRGSSCGREERQEDLNLAG